MHGHTNKIKMENNELKGTIKNCTCHFNDQIKSKILILMFHWMKTHMKIFGLNNNKSSCKTLTGAKLLCIMFNKIDGCIRVSGGTRYLVLFYPEKDDAISNRMKYLLSQKGGITYIISHDYAKIKIDSYNSLPLEKALPLHNVIMLIKLVFNNDQNHCYYNIIYHKNVCIN